MSSATTSPRSTSRAQRESVNSIASSASTSLLSSLWQSGASSKSAGGSRRRLGPDPRERAPALSPLGQTLGARDDIIRARVMGGDQVDSAPRGGISDRLGDRKST